MAAQYSAQTAVVSYYLGSSYPFYTAEGYLRSRFYPPPYWYNSQWYYATPWLWMDGNPDPAYIYSNWETHLLNRIPVPSQLEIDVSASYNQYTNQGSAEISIFNEGSDTLSRKLFCVLTESNLYYSAPNGLQWHGHVCRDMIPDNYGTNIMLYPGDTTFADLAFIFDPSWVSANCEVICFVQHDSLTADSIKEIMQGAKTPLMANTVEETPVSFNPVFSIKYTVDRRLKIEYSLTHPSRVGIEIADVSGRIIFSENIGLQNAGSNVYYINPADLNCSPGALFLIFKTDTLIKAEKITVF